MAFDLEKAIDNLAIRRSKRVLLFEYGTLMHTQDPPHTEDAWRPAEIHGNVHNVDGYKGATDIGKTTNKIKGEVAKISAFELESLDKREDVDKGDYKRIKTKTLDGTEVYVYQWAGKKLHKTTTKPLEKGQNGDWQKEGYKMSHTIERSEHPMDDPKLRVMHVRVHAPNGELAAHIPVSFGWEPTGKLLNPDMSEVKEAHRRKGIASAAYAYAEKTIGGKMMPGYEQSHDAHALWRQPNKPFGKSVVKFPAKQLAPPHSDFRTRASTPSGKPISYDPEMMWRDAVGPAHLGMTADEHAHAAWHHENQAQRAFESNRGDSGRVHRLYSKWHSDQAMSKDPTISYISTSGSKPEIERRLGKSALPERKQISSIAVIDGNRILMGKRNDNQRWTLPGGHLNPNEDPKIGALRELEEEAGISPNNIYHLATNDVTTYTGKEMTIHSYVVFGYYGTDPEQDPDEEVQVWVWVDITRGLPQNIKDRLHSPKNSTLAALGLIDED